MPSERETPDVLRIRTLGPKGTNCEAAAKHYIKSHNLDSDVILHDTLEGAMEDVLQEPSSALLGCVVYPDLHNLVFPYLDKLYLSDLFLYDTFNMVLATRHGHQEHRLVATHPAPQALVKNDYSITLASSNSAAAQSCQAGEVDACVTTLPAAEALGLDVIKKFGEVQMGFSIHTHIKSALL